MNTLDRVTALAAALSLCGCQSFAPVWPMAGSWVPPPGYPELTECPKSDTTTASTTTLDNARKTVLCLAIFYSGEERRIEAVRNGETIALFGLGTTAGINLIQHTSSSPNSGSNQLQRLGIAAGGLLGFNQAVGIDGQHTIYNAGRVALDCVMRMDLALDAAKDTPRSIVQQRDANLVTGSGTSLAIKSDATLGFAGSPKMMTEVMAAAKANTISAFEAATFAQVTGSIAIAGTESSKLKGELAKATDPGVRIPALVDARNQINLYVENALHNNTDPSQIFTAMKAGIQKLGGNAADEAKKVQTVTSIAADHATFLSLGGTSTFSAKTELSTLLIAQADADGAQPLVDTYQQCITGLPSTPPK